MATAAERAEARRKKILAKSKTRLAYASGHTTSRPSTAAPDTPPSRPLTAGGPSNFHLSVPRQRGSWELSEKWRIGLIILGAFILGGLGEFAGWVGVSALEAFVALEVVLSYGGISKMMVAQAGGFLDTLMSVVNGMRVVKAFVSDLAFFAFFWMWAVRIGQILRKLGYIRL